MIASNSTSHQIDLFNPTDAHLSLRESVSGFAEKEMDEQAKEHDEHETFNTGLFKNWVPSLEFSESLSRKRTEDTDWMPLLPLSFTKRCPVLIRVLLFPI